MWGTIGGVRVQIRVGCIQGSFISPGAISGPKRSYPSVVVLVHSLVLMFRRGHCCYLPCYLPELTLHLKDALTSWVILSGGGNSLVVTNIQLSLVWPKITCSAPSIVFRAWGGTRKKNVQSYSCTANSLRHWDILLVPGASFSLCSSCLLLSFLLVLYLCHHFLAAMTLYAHLFVVYHEIRNVKQ